MPVSNFAVPTSRHEQQPSSSAVGFADGEDAVVVLRKCWGWLLTTRARSSRDNDTSALLHGGVSGLQGSLRRALRKRRIACHPDRMTMIIRGASISFGTFSRGRRAQYRDRHVMFPSMASATHHHITIKASALWLPFWLDNLPRHCMLSV